MSTLRMTALARVPEHLLKWAESQGADGGALARRAEFESLRSEMARKLLQDRTLVVSEIAFLLGYSEASSFYRAFRRWEQVSPHEYRQAAN